MRRKEKQIIETQELEDIINQADSCRLAMSRNNQPYIVPLCFGYEHNTLYFHSADEGKKLDLIRQNSNVCFEFDIINKIVNAKNACNWGINYLSIIGTGKASFVEDERERVKAMDLIMKQYSDEPWEYKPEMLKKTLSFKVKITEMTGKKSGTNPIQN